MNRNSQKTRQRILHAAAEIFSEKGFRGATVRQICARAGANVAAINYHFDSKEKLYIETCRYIFRDASALNLSREPIRVATEEDWKRELWQWTASLLDQVTSDKQAHVWEARMFSRERAEPSQVLPVLLKEFFLPIKERLDTLLRMALPADAAPALLQTWSINIIAQCTVYAQHETPWDRLLFPAKLSREAWLEMTARHIVDGILVRLKFRAAPPRPS